MLIGEKEKKKRKKKEKKKKKREREKKGATFQQTNDPSNVSNSHTDLFPHKHLGSRNISEINGCRHAAKKR